MRFLISLMLCCGTGFLVGFCTFRPTADTGSKNSSSEVQRAPVQAAEGDHHARAPVAVMLQPSDDERHLIRKDHLTDWQLYKVAYPRSASFVAHVIEQQIVQPERMSFLGECLNREHGDRLVLKGEVLVSADAIRATGWVCEMMVNDAQGACTCLLKIVNNDVIASAGKMADGSSIIESDYSGEIAVIIQ